MPLLLPPLFSFTLHLLLCAYYEVVWSATVRVPNNFISNGKTFNSKTILWTETETWKTKAEKEFLCAKMLLTLHYDCQEWNVENGHAKSETSANSGTHTENSITFSLCIYVYVCTKEWECSWTPLKHWKRSSAGSKATSSDNSNGSLIQTKSVRQSEYAQWHTFISNIQIKMPTKAGAHGHTHTHTREKNRTITSTTFHNHDKCTPKEEYRGPMKCSNKTLCEYDITKSVSVENMGKKPCY